MKILVALLFCVLSLFAVDPGDWMATKICSPKYPLLALQSRLAGNVTLRIHLDSLGAVSDIKVLTGNPLLASAAQDNLRAWTFARTPRSSADDQAGLDLEFIYEFKIRDKFSPNPDIQFVFEYPGHVTVTGSAPHWTP